MVKIFRVTAAAGRERGMGLQPLVSQHRYLDPYTYTAPLMLVT